MVAMVNKGKELFGMEEKGTWWLGVITGEKKKEKKKRGLLWIEKPKLLIPYKENVD